jgi:hypothetical protein
MIKEAEIYVEEDKKRHQWIELKNNAYTVDKAMKFVLR